MEESLPEPDFDKVHQPDLPEVLQRLENGTVGEVSDPHLSNDVQKIVFFNTPELPPADMELYVNGAGDVVYDASRRYDTDFKGWEPGDVVHARSTRTVRHERHGALSLRLTTTNWRIPTEMYHLSTEDQALIADAGLAEVDVDVRIDEKQPTFIAQHYAASIEHINAIEAPWDGEAPLIPGMPALVEGEVVDYQAAEYGQPRSGSLTVRLANGSMATFTADQPLYLEDGKIDVVYPHAPAPGDVIQVRAADDIDADPYHLSNIGGFLTKPSAERQEAYEATRLEIAGRLTELAGLEGAAFRQAYGEILRTYVLPKAGSSLVESLFTYDERAALHALRSEKFPVADGEKFNPDEPIVTTHHGDEQVRDNTHQLIEVGEAYGVDTLTMSRSEYYAFCKQLATHRIEPAKGNNRLLTPFFIVQDTSFSDAECLELWRTTLDTWLPSMEGKTRHLAWEGGFDPQLHFGDAEQQVTYDVVYLLSRQVADDPESLLYAKAMYPTLPDMLRSCLESSLQLGGQGALTAEFES
jgi:hypothetical protein